MATPKVKYVGFGYTSRRQSPECHIEFPMGMIHIVTGLSDEDGRPVTRISITPDETVIFEGASGRMIGLLRGDPDSIVEPYTVTAQTITKPQEKTSG